jgi:hypothetical protein
MSARRATRPSHVIVIVLALLLSLIATLTVTQRVAAQSDFSTLLSGAAEVPGPGDPDGSGFAVVFVDPGVGQVCAHIEVTAIQLPATAAHIHEGAAGVSGDIVVTLPTPGADGVADSCVGGLDAMLLQDIHDNPADYYVNVHTGEFPAGAVRGQLMPAVTLWAGLDGASEVPGPGDPDGQGFARQEFFVDGGAVCGFVDSSDIGAPTMAHIHVGAVGVAGPPVVTLPAANADGFITGCVHGVDSALLQQIVDDPAGYYINVHTAEYPAGAIRGQLSTEPPPPPACAPGVLCNGLIVPGTYTYTGFGTDLTFTTATDWFFFGDEIPSMNLFDPMEAAGLSGFPFVGQVFADPCDFESVTTIGDSPTELMAWLGDRAFLDTTAPVAVTYGGAAGLQVDLVAVTVPPECTDPPWVLVFSLPIVGDFHFEASSVARIVALDVAGETLLFIAEHFDPEGNPDAFLARAQGVLNSFSFALAAPPTPTPPPSPPPPAAAAATPTPRPASPPLPNTASGPLSGSADLAVILLGAGLSLSALALVRRRRAAR